jgi:serine/threonine protein kinase
MNETPANKGFPEASTVNSADSESPSASYPEFEGYLILEELPPGGQAIVYKALHKATKTKVALKVLPPGLHSSTKARNRFEQEVELIASLNHPNIVAIRDSGISKGQYYFSMEYIHGQPLYKYVVSKNLSIQDSLILFEKICDAVAHAHQRGVIHRDLKPANIIIDERGEPHVLDFGLAKAAGRFTAVSEKTVMPSITGNIKGTLTYMSPEQAAGRPDLVDTRTDIYSLGVILYRMLIRRFPYDVSGSTLEVLQNVRQAELVRPRQIISRFDSDVEAILLKALEKDPKQRYQSVAELANDLECWLQGLPITARSVTTLYVLRKMILRHRTASAVLGLLLVIILSTAFFSSYYYVQAKSAVKSLEAEREGYKLTAERYITFANQVAFSVFIELWHDGKNARAQGIAVYFDEGSPEQIAATFLLDPRPLEEKRSDFEQRLSARQPSFWEFVVAEYHLQNKNESEALNAYRRCLGKSRNDSELDDWFVNRAERNINELANENTTSDGNLEANGG